MLLTSSARAADKEGCLLCHQYRGLARIQPDGKTISLYYIDPNYHDMSLGAHARLKCTDCHIRSEVEVVPHRQMTPVDCTRSCHLDAATKMEMNFGHQGISDMLDKSVHTPAVLEKANALLDSPLKPGQSRCLLCHDEPSFLRPGQSWAAQEAPNGRCGVCHEKQLPLDTRYFYFHVTARGRPMRSNQDVVRTCALCHSNPKVRAEFNLPDSTASYLVSFHGKATLLGSQETANCLDCHVGQMQNVHSMQSKTQAGAPTNPARIADTCRTPNCHRSAGAQISSAAVHLELNAGGAEYLIGIIFVALIVFTFGPSLLIAMLKMFHIVLGRHDPHHHEHLERAEKILAHPQGKALLARFTSHQRVQHWFLVICFATLCLTGFPMKFADRPWAAWLIGEFGGLTWARRFHHWAGALLICGFVYHMTYIICGVIQRRRKSGESLFKIIMSLPMTVTPKDGLEMNKLLLYLLFLRKKRPESGRFNPEEKFEYIGVFWGTFVLGTTGMLMWFNAWTSRHLPGRILTIATLLHTFEAFLALLHVGIVHMASVIFAPGVFPISKAMFTGDTPAEELVEGHAAMLTAAEEALGARLSPAASAEGAGGDARAPGEEANHG